MVAFNPKQALRSNVKADIKINKTKTKNEEKESISDTKRKQTTVACQLQICRLKSNIGDGFYKAVQKGLFHMNHGNCSLS